MFSVVVSIFFFFQAEDGIRDLTVTGVQTCALPIYSQTREHSSFLESRRQAARARGVRGRRRVKRSEEHTSELQSQSNLVCRLLLEKKKKILRQGLDSHELLRGRHARALVGPCPQTY